MKDDGVARDGWIERDDGDGVWLHARRWPCRMDLAVTMAVPARAGVRLARAIRQDMWRALRDLRGFAPVVRVMAAPVEAGETAGRTACVTAGGQIDAPWPRAATEARLAALLADPAHQARWQAWSARGAGLLVGVLMLMAPDLVRAQSQPSEMVTGAPSGLPLLLQEVRIEPLAEGTALARFRLVAPDLATVEFARVEPDFPWLCETLALPQLARDGVAAAQVVISIASAPIPFGESMPEVTQYFEVFRPEGDRCIWEVF